MAVNNVILKGNVSQPPYFDRLGERQFPFLRFYLAVDPNDLALTILKGGVVQPPFFNRFGEEEEPFLRLYLAVERPGRPARQDADFLRVVAYGDTALFAWPYLRPGSQVLVSGNLRARKRRVRGGATKTVVEVVANDDIDFLGKVDWEGGDAERERILAERGEEYVPNERRIPHGGFLRVVAYNDLALFAYPYLQVGSLLFVRGRLQARKRVLPNGDKETIIEVAAQDITFLRNINWEAGNAERDRILTDREGEEA